MGDSLYTAAVQNPIFQNAAQNAMFEAVNKDDEATIQRNKLMYAENQHILDCPPEEIEAMKKWANYLRYTMLIIATLMMVCAYYNFANGSNSVSTNFLALYILFFSCIICCYELAFKQVSIYIVQNFGFMFNPWGRTIFLILVEIMLFQLSTFGQVLFAVLLLAMVIQIYVNIKHKRFERYLRLTHMHIKVESAMVVQQREENASKSGSWFV